MQKHDRTSWPEIWFPPVARYASGNVMAGHGVVPCMRNSDQYRKFARECERLAQSASSPAHKAALKEMAAAWMSLAQEAERKERNAREPSNGR
jgi:hypothetical protein